MPTLSLAAAVEPPERQEVAATRSPREHFTRLYAAHGPLLGRTVRSYARTAAEREDLDQEVALAIWRALPSFRGDASERTFVLRIAHNQAITFMDKRRRTPTAAVTTVDADEMVHDAPDPEVIAGLSERMRALFAALHKLPFGQRQVLVLALEGLSHEEIGEVLGVTANNVAVRLNRARNELRRSMDHG